MTTWNTPLADPPDEPRRRALWLQHVAGHILMEDVRGAGLEKARAGEDAAAAVDGAVYGLMQVIDGVTGKMHNDDWEVSVRVRVELRRSDGEAIGDEIDLTDEGDGFCMGIHGWVEGDCGRDPILEGG